MFLTLGLEFQVWNLENSFQNWKNIHFLTLELQFQVWNLEISFQNWKKTYILQCKMYVFDSGASISSLEPWNFIPKLKKHTFYSAKCMFLTLGLQFQAWNLEISFQNWKKHTFYSVKCMFLTLGLKFQVWNLEISFQNWKNIHFTV